jgi:hypothetical protein
VWSIITQVHARARGRGPTTLRRVRAAHHMRTDHLATCAPSPQPDGTYMWLQSFILKYSLIEWMANLDRLGQRYLTHEALVAKLEALIELMARSEAGWTMEANEIYKELFFVDVLKLKTTVQWTQSVHSLSHFSWNVACEYLLPGGNSTITR